MGNRSSTAPKRRPEDADFNPFQEVRKIIGFAEESGRIRRENFTVYIEEGILVWSKFILPNKTPGFITVIDRTKFAAGLSNKAWRRLEEKIAIEMTKQRKAW